MSRTALLRAWLAGPTAEKRWDALERLRDVTSSASASLTIRTLVRLVLERLDSDLADGIRLRRKARRRRRAAIALLQLCKGTTPEGRKVQTALAKSLALALPRRLARPSIMTNALGHDDCRALACEACTEGALHGWSSLHRKYSTQDMPIERLRANGDRIRAHLTEHLLPEFPKRFGSQFGPHGELRYVSLFVVRYTVDELNGQRGLAGHVDESLVRTQAP